MKNNKGFTITELLVIVAIMLSVLGIAIYGYSKISEKQKLEARKRVYEQVESAAEQYFATNEYIKNDLTDNKFAYVSVGTLVESDYMNVVIDPVTGKQLDNCTIVKVSSTEAGIVYNVLTDEKEVEEAKQILGNNKTCKYEPIVVDPKLTRLTVNIYEAEKGCAKGELLDWKTYLGTETNEEWFANEGKWFNTTNAPLGLVVEFVTSDKSSITYSLDGEESKVIKNNERICITKDKKELKLSTIYGNNVESITKVNLDKTNPICTLNADGTNGTNGWFISNVNINFKSKTDNLNVISSYGLSTTTYNNTNKLNSLTLASDTKSQSYYGAVKDEAGNIGKCSIVVKRDTEVPTVALNAYSGTDSVINSLDTTAKVDNAIKNNTVTLLANSWVNRKVVLRSSANDSISGLAKVECVDPRDKSTFKDFRRIMDTSEGELSFSCVAYDNAGNKSNNGSNNQIAIKRDLTPPTLKINSYASADENGAVNKTSKIAYTSDTWYKGWAWVEAVAEDTLSNVIITYVRKKGTLGGSGEKNLTVDGGKSLTYSDYSAKEGISNYYFKACDVAGNCTGNINNIAKIVKLDRTAPTSPAVALIDGNWNEVSNDTWYNKDIYVSGQAKSSDPNPTASDTYSGISYYQISTDNKNWATWGYNYNSDVYRINFDGTTYRYVRAIDKAGNISAVTTKIIKRDTVAPTCGSFVGQGSESSWINKTTSLQTRTITASCFDSTNGSGCVANPAQSYAQDAKTAAFNQTIKDKAGNSATCSATVGVYIDKTEPTCGTPTGQGTAASWINSYSSNKTRVVTAACSDSMSGCAALPTQSYDQDAITAAFNRTIKDKAGNSKACSYTVGVYRDITPPPAPTVALVNNQWEEVSNNTWYNVNVYISGQASSSNPNPISNDNLSGTSYYQISTDNSNWTTWAYDSKSTTYRINWDGTTNRYVRAVDKAGNISATTTKTIKRDTVAPSCTLTSSGTIKTVSRQDDNTVNVTWSDDAGRYIPIITSKTKTYSNTNKDDKPTTDWYSSDVNFSLSYSDDRSGVDEYGIEAGGYAYNSLSSLTHTTDTAGKSYGGVVKDNAGNVTKCAIKIRRDTTPPVVKTKGGGPINCLSSGSTGANSYGYSVKAYDALNKVSIRFTQYYTATYCTEGTYKWYDTSKQKSYDADTEGIYTIFARCSNNPSPKARFLLVDTAGNYVTGGITTSTASDPSSNSNSCNSTLWWDDPINKQ